MEESPWTGRERVPDAARDFVTTRWSAVVTAGNTDSPDARQALDWLCGKYWYPLYAWLRREGQNPHDAEDLIQGFFARFLEKDYLGDVSRTRGRFRSFLLASLKHFVANERDRARAQKRGGGQTLVALDHDEAETRYRHEPGDTMSADRVYERRWALTVLEQALARLRTEHEESGKGVLFDTLKDCLTGSREAQPYAILAGQLAMSEGSVKVAVHRLRQRYRALLRDTIASTVSNDGEVDEELRHLVTVLRS